MLVTAYIAKMLTQYMFDRDNYDIGNPIQIPFTFVNIQVLNS